MFIPKSHARRRNFASPDSLRRPLIWTLFGMLLTILLEHGTMEAAIPSFNVNDQTSSAANPTAMNETFVNLGALAQDIQKQLAGTREDLSKLLAIAKTQSKTSETMRVDIDYHRFLLEKR